MAPLPTIAVWDPLVRIVHWAVALAVVIDLFNEAGANPWHRGLGYAAGTLVLARLAWGLLGPRFARLAAMARAAGRALPYVRALAHGEHDVHYGHNPLGACMAFALWAAILVTVLTGGLLRLHAFWGDETIETVHTVSAYVIGSLALLHVAGVAATSALYRSNLLGAMITGRKREAFPDRR